MSFIIKCVEFFEKNWEFIKNNWYIFLIFVLLTVAITSSFYKAKEKKISEKHRCDLEKQKEQSEKSINDLETTIANQNKQLEECTAIISSLKEQLEKQRECYSKLQTEAWLAASKVEPCGTAAKKMSEHVQRKTDGK